MTVSGLAVAAFLLAFWGARTSGGAHASPPALRPLRGPVGGLALPQLSQVPALPALAAPAPKPKPVVARRPRTSSPAKPRRRPAPKKAPSAAPAATSVARSRQQPAPAQTSSAAPAAARHTTTRAAPTPVVIVGSG